MWLEMEKSEKRKEKRGIGPWFQKVHLQDQRRRLGSWFISSSLLPRTLSEAASYLHIPSVPSTGHQSKSGNRPLLLNSQCLECNRQPKTISWTNHQCKGDSWNLDGETVLKGKRNWSSGWCLQSGDGNMRSEAMRGNETEVGGSEIRYRCNQGRKHRNGRI